MALVENIQLTLLEVYFLDPNPRMLQWPLLYNCWILKQTKWVFWTNIKMLEEVNYLFKLWPILPLAHCAEGRRINQTQQHRWLQSRSRPHPVSLVTPGRILPGDPLIRPATFACRTNACFSCSFLFFRPTLSGYFWLWFYWAWKRHPSKKCLHSAIR